MHDCMALILMHYCFTGLLVACLNNKNYMVFCSESTVNGESYTGEKFRGSL